MPRELEDRALGLLRSHEFWTAGALAAELGVSLRTVRRVLARLLETGVPLESASGRGGGVRLAGHPGLRELRLEHPGSAASVRSSGFRSRRLSAPPSRISGAACSWAHPLRSR